MQIWRSSFLCLNHTQHFRCSHKKWPIKEHSAPEKKNHWLLNLYIIAHNQNNKWHHSNNFCWDFYLCWHEHTTISRHHSSVSWHLLQLLFHYFHIFLTEKNISEISAKVLSRVHVVRPNNTSTTHRGIWTMHPRAITYHDLFTPAIIGGSLESL